MPVEVTPGELELLANIPHPDLVAMAIDLDIVVDTTIEPVALYSACVDRILDRASDEGLPFSKYDLDDLQELPPEHLAALATLMGCRSSDAKAVLKLGQKVYKHYQKNRPDNPTALLLPTLLPIVARAAAARLNG